MKILSRVASAVAAYAFVSSFAFGANVTLSVSGNASLSGTNFTVVGTGTLSGPTVNALGTAQLLAAGTVNYNNLTTTTPITGNSTLIFASGDVLVVSFSLPAGILIPMIGGSTSSTGTITVTGGTGQFAGATGSLTTTGSANATGQFSSTIQLSGNGTLTLPASSSSAQILPQFAFGDGWYSALYFSNTGTNTVSFPVNFTADNGTPLAIPSLGGSSTTLTIAAGGTALIEAPNSGHLQQGYVSMALPAGVIAYGVFRQSVPGIADQEAVVPLSKSSATSAVFPFDDTTYTTAIAIVNPSNSPAFVNITVKDASGRTLGTSTLPLLAQSKTEAVLRSLSGLSAMAGARGSAEFTVSTGNVAVLGLRFNGAAFTSIPAVEQ